MTTTPLKPVRKELTFGFAVFILTVVVAIIASGMMFFSLKLQMLMLCCWVVCAGFGWYLGFSYAELEAGAYEFIARAMGAVLIMMSVGALIGAWISAGTVAVMIYIGLKIITPEFFLATSFILCSMTSVFTGTRPDGNRRGAWLRPRCYRRNGHQRRLPWRQDVPAFGYDQHGRGR